LKDIVSLSGNEKILLMDDSESILIGLSLGLKRKGYRVATVKDGREAVSEYKQAMNEGSPYAVVILDLNISDGLGGYETMEILNEVNPEIKVIVTSGNSDDPVIARFRDYGFVDKLEKPYRIKDICIKIRTIFNG